jgi:hypothetical protein
MSTEVTLKWADVTALFSEDFLVYITRTNKQKLYFSFDEKIEGPNKPWMLLSFVDGLLLHLEPDQNLGISILYHPYITVTVQIMFK